MASSANDLLLVYYIKPSVNSQVSKKYVSKDVCAQIHEKAAPFLKWLQEAEEESSEEEDEDEAIEVVYASAAEREKIMMEQKQKENNVDEDELDIDDI